jgi:hypothetical protein
MAHHLVHQEEHRGAVLFGKVKARHRQVKRLPHRSGCQCNDRMVAVGSPASLHHVTLGRAGGQPSAGAGSHHVDNHARDLGHHRIAKVLLHQRKARTAGRRHRLKPAHRSADHRGDAGDLVLHLDEFAAQLGQLAGHDLGDLRRGRNGVSGKEAAPRCQGAQRRSVVSLDQLHSHRSPPGKAPCSANSVNSSSSSTSSGSRRRTVMAISGQWVSHQ